MKFNSRKDTLFTLLFVGVAVLMLFVTILVLLSSPSLTEALIIVATTVAVAGLLLWIYLGTHYQINEQFLTYSSGPFRGRVAISEIKAIIRGKTLWAGTKPATARKGLIVNYQGYNEIYISPEEEEKFLNKLLDMNPSIKVIRAADHPTAYR